MPKLGAFSQTREKKEAGKFQDIRAPVILRKGRAKKDVAFPPQKHAATSELLRWNLKGCILPSVEKLASRAGPIDQDNADAYLAKEIVCTGMELLTLLNAFHLNPIVES